MEGLVPATATATPSTFQLILEHLCAILLLVSEDLRQDPALPAVLSVILLGALVAVVSLTVNRRLTSGSVKVPDKRSPARDEVCTRRGENTGPMTEADDTPKPPGVEASPLWLQTLCVKALNEHLSRMSSLQDLADLVRMVRRIQPPRCAHVTDKKPVTKAPGTDREQLQENVPGDLNKNARHPESPELHQDEIGGQKQDIGDKEEEKQGLELSAAPMERDLQRTVSQSLTVGGAPPQTRPGPEVLRGPLAHVKSQAERQSKAEIGDPFVHGSEGDLKGAPRDADLNVHLPRADQENRATARQLWEQKQVNDKLAAEIRSLRTEKASLSCENLNLKAEVQQLKLKLRARADAQEDCLTRLHQQVLEAEMRCLAMEKEHFNNWRTVNATLQMLNMYRKMTQDMSQDLRRSTCCYENEIRHQQERARGAQTAAAHMERKVQELRREIDHSRQVLAKAKATATFRPFPGGPAAPAAAPVAPPAAHRGPEGPGRPLGHVTRPQEGAGSRGKSSGMQAHLQI
ncbi:hypothetical protein HJG60_010379 [Phyllostomus discolor]|uniref:Uncharacterized protein n=1 Tax=Phyllostomus discolor TaxID=89673 RepID=A0A834AYL4_9CHIR|nr:hypothetical protein HJG60_010379 [Phyllostomus discolor]